MGKFFCGELRVQAAAGNISCYIFELCSFGRYDVMLVPIDRDRDNVYIIEFKVHKTRKEKNWEILSQMRSIK